MSLKYFVNYIRTKKCYFYFLLLQLVLIVGLIVYVFIDYEKKHQDLAAVVLEIIVTSIVICELILRLIYLKSAFFKSIWNIVDLVTVLVIIGLYITFAIIENIDTDDYSSGDVILPVLLGIRYFVQVIRVIMMMEQNREIRKVAKKGIILGEDDDDEEESETGSRTLYTKLSLLDNNADPDSKQ